MLSVDANNPLTLQVNVTANINKRQSAAVMNDFLASRYFLCHCKSRQDTWQKSTNRNRPSTRYGHEQEVWAQFARHIARHACLTASWQQCSGKVTGILIRSSTYTSSVAAADSSLPPASHCQRISITVDLMLYSRCTWSLSHLYPTCTTLAAPRVACS